MNVLVTGGAGYIGSHTCVALLSAGHEVTVLDNLVNSKEESLRRVARIAGRAPAFRRVDLLDRGAVKAVFDAERFDAVIHFAGLKAVGESVREPWSYYHNNVVGSLYLFEEMAAHGVFRLVFSSSATVYGSPDRVPIDETFPLTATSPYGRTKLMLEEIQRDLAVADPRWRILLLRYFNPVGAHASGTIGEDPNGIPNNLMPFVTQVAVGRLPVLRVFGDDYPTPDGTCIRDYIHVEDLAEGHLKALEALDRIAGCDAVNLGTGRGYSVLEMIRAFEVASGRTVKHEIAPRRAGDVVACYADPSKAAALLGWRARRGIEAMCQDAWRWQLQNPQGYGA
jgi:UDP-glucose 4-epimerase